MWDYVADIYSTSKHKRLRFGLRNTKIETKRSVNSIEEGPHKETASQREREREREMEEQGA
jgi:hypothetical protein